MPFKKGQSGNPNGRPKVRLPDGRCLSDLAKEHTATAVETLVRIASSKAAAEAAQVAAAVALLDRGWGKPSQGVELSGKDGDPIRHVLRVELEAVVPK